jgi:NADPH:quinone reductase
MRALVCESYGLPRDLVLREWSSPKPGPNEVVVSVRAAAVNFPDTLIIQGLYQFKPDLPFVPGSDLSGVVKEVGAKITHLKTGDEVFGFVANGAFAEEVLVSGLDYFLKPPQMSFEIGASFMMAYGTSYHALKDRARIRQGETLLVLGASGGVGLAAIELGKLMGARVIAAASTEGKLQLCKKQGADELINYTSEDLKARLKELTHGKGIDVIYDPVGGTLSEVALRGISWQGRYLVVGFAAGEIPKIPLNLPLLKGCQIVGVFWGSFVMKDPKSNLKNTIELMEMYAKGQLKPRIHATYVLEEATKALEEMMDRKVSGKAIINMA